MRGKVIQNLPAVLQARITPAYAGKSLRFLTCNQHFQDHPRLCGEKKMPASGFCSLKGSPPPMRGKALLSLIHFIFFRITPAYAGKRRVKIPIAKCPQDHPRLCGEKYFSFSVLQYVPGSPPPMRGKELKKPPSSGVLRITPAYAGKSGCTDGHCSRILDHPRLCGEKQRKQDLIDKSSGSPPPMRGKAISSRRSPTAPGITPAYAGKSSFALDGAEVAKDHPRLCGEKLGLTSTLGVALGSPPPMRGKGSQRHF